MAKGFDKDVVYKERITALLLVLLEIADEDVDGSRDFEEAYRKRLKFQKITDWKRFRASVDLLDDTEYAIMNVFRYQLGDISSNKSDAGEMYLRLYGVLNAVYLQMNAFIQIANLLNFPTPENIASGFQKLDIYKLRGIAGAHTVDYLYDKQILESKPELGKKTSFRILQMDLNKIGNKITALDENNITYKFNLLEVLTEYEKIATDLLVRLILHSINTLVYKKNDKAEIKKRLDELLPKLVNYSKIDKNKEYRIRKNYK